MARKRLKASKKPVKKKLPPVRSVGHGKVHKLQLTKKQLQEVKEKGYTYVTIKGVRKKVTKANIRGGAVYWYMRSDTKKPALRNFKRDRELYAHHKALKKKGGMTGD